MSMDAFAAQVGADVKALRQNTGWRNVSHPSVTAGKVQFRRTGGDVEMILDGAVFGALTGTQVIEGLVPTGFVIDNNVWMPFTTTPVYGPALGCRFYDQATYARGTLQIFGLTSGAALRAYASWKTTSPFPNVLPGTPA